MDGFEQRRSGRMARVTEGEWAGWLHDAGDAFEQIAGPFYVRRDPDGRMRCAFRPEARHMNGNDTLHGGCVMTFVDYALFCIAADVLGDEVAVTASFNGDLVGAVRQGVLVECTGEVVRAGRSLVFVRALLTAGDRTVMSCSAVIKRGGAKPSA